MSKVAAYLQEHILGEVSVNSAILNAMSHDGSILEITPEMVVYPRVTNDIRKVARFAWQLAEKGHTLPITARGSGTDQTGAAIGKGIILSMPAHMNRILEFDPKQKLVRVQPGVNAQSVNDALALHGVGIPSLPMSATYSTIGGAVLNNECGPLSGKYGDMNTWTHQLEIVLANGDVLQTERLSKRELNKKKGLQTFEGEIYRNIDNLIEDNKQVINEKLGGTVRDNVGYSSISKVKQKDGSFDLAPLFIGSQGTLGIVSEMIMKSEYISEHTAMAAIAFTSKEAARDMLDQLSTLDPALLEYYDGELFTLAANQGKKYNFYKEVDGILAAVILIGFDDFSERNRLRNLKKVKKFTSKIEAYLSSADGEDALDLLAIREVTAYSVNPGGKDMSAPPLFDGAYIPRARFEEFSTSVSALATKYNVTLPLHNRALENIVYTRATLQLHKVSDKQKIFKLLDEYSSLVDQYGGHLIAEGGEGRLKARFAYKVLDDDVKELFTAIKAVFDPHGILNPGVKQDIEMRQLVSHLHSDYDTSRFATHVPYN
jgi:FAD/FMN-containing dehydrogenase